MRSRCLSGRHRRTAANIAAATLAVFALTLSGVPGALADDVTGGTPSASATETPGPGRAPQPDAPEPSTEPSPEAPPSAEPSAEPSEAPEPTDETAPSAQPSPAPTEAETAPSTQPEQSKPSKPTKPGRPGTPGGSDEGDEPQSDWPKLPSSAPNPATLFRLLGALAADEAPVEVPIPGAWNANRSSVPGFGDATFGTGAQGQIEAPPSGGAWIHFAATPSGPGWESGVNVTSPVPTVPRGQYIVTWDAAASSDLDVKMSVGHVHLSSSPIPGSTWVRHKVLMVELYDTGLLTLRFGGSSSQAQRPEAGLSNVTIARAEPAISGPATESVAAGTSKTVRLPLTNAGGCRITDGAQAWATARMSSDRSECVLTLTPGAEVSGEFPLTLAALNLLFDPSATHPIAITVVPALDHIRITPGDASIVAGTSQSFTATAYSVADVLIGDVTSTTTFAFDDGPGTCTANVCSSTVAGPHQITATHAGLTDAAQLTVTPAAARSLRLTPGAATITAGDTQTYTAHTYDAHGNVVADVTESTVFVAAGAASCTGAVCGSDTVGIYTVAGSHSAFTASAWFEVTPGAVSRMQITPVDATITAGDTQTYTARTYDAHDNLVADVTSSTSFIPTAAVTCTGAVCGSETAGTFSITAVGSGHTDTTSLTVVPAALHHLNLSPSASTIAAGDTQTFRTTSHDRFGNQIADVTASAVLSSASADCSGNACGSQTAGSHTITTRDQGLDATASLTVTAAAASTLRITPAEATVVAGEQQTYVTSSYDQFGNLVADVSDDTVLTSEGADCAANACSSERTGTYTVTASHLPAPMLTRNARIGELTTSASLTVVAAPLASIDLTPAHATIGAGDRQAYEVEGLDAFGNSRGILTDEAAFAIDGDATCSAARCGSTVAGRYLVTASAMGQSATAQLTVRSIATPPAEDDDSSNASPQGSAPQGSTVLPDTGSTLGQWQLPAGVLLALTGTLLLLAARRRRAAH